MMAKEIRFGNASTRSDLNDLFEKVSGYDFKLPLNQMRRERRVLSRRLRENPSLSRAEALACVDRQIEQRMRPAILSRFVGK